LGHSVRALREEEKGTISWKIKFRNGTEKNFCSPITTKPWGEYIPELAAEPSPSKDVYDGELLYNEPKYLKTGEIATADDGLPEMQKIGKLKQGVYY
jgi:adenylylsulfate reductase subunit B